MRGRSRSTGSDEPPHASVLAAEVVSMLAPKPDGVYIDCTVGFGGHADALLEAGAGRVIGVDRDEQALALARERLARWGGRVVLMHSDYRSLADIARATGISAANGVLADLGVSSMQFDDASRGFSFRQSGPLDMRMDRSTGTPLGDRLATIDEGTLADVIFKFGEERKSRRVARAILAARDNGTLKTTADLAAAARRGAGTGRWERIDPATRTFQALRIWVNEELDGLEAFVESAVNLLAPSGRLAVIAFHSLEDRLMKQTMRALAAGGRVALITRRPTQPSDEEVARNPRARSARLRVVEKAA